MVLGFPFLSLILPLTNKENKTVSRIRKVQKILIELNKPYEIIIVVDGLPNKNIKRILKKNISQLKIISYPKQTGKWYALRLGMKKAKGKYVMFIDSGDEIDPKGIAMLLLHLEWYRADIIIGSKRHPASQVKYPLVRKILSYGYHLLVLILFNLKLSDTQAGIKVIKRKVLQKVLPKLIEKKFAGDLELLVVAKHLGFRKIYEAPIRLNFKFKSVSEAATLRSVRGIFLDTLAIFYRLNIKKYYD